VALMQVSRPNARGEYSMGLRGGLPAARPQMRARVLIGRVSTNVVPWTNTEKLSCTRTTSTLLVRVFARTGNATTGAQWRR
jgi:hypothetical protein